MIGDSLARQIENGDFSPCAQHANSQSHSMGNIRGVRSDRHTDPTRNVDRSASIPPLLTSALER